MTQQRLLIIDGHSLAFRAYFALDAAHFSTQEGMSTNAIWGFANMLTTVVNDEHPTHIAVAFDVKGGTFRNTLLPQYKGTRDAAPEDLLPQFPYIQQLLTALGITYIEKPGYEGDDIIGTLATMGSKAGIETLVLSGDRDAFQLIDEHVTVLYPGHHFRDLKHMDAQAILEKYKVSPEQYPDLAALRGETADNIPGVPGVGDGFAAKWIAQFGSLNGIIEHKDEITGKKGEALREHVDQVLLNRKVNALVRDLDLGISIDELACTGSDVHALDSVLHTLEFGARTRSKLLKAFPAQTGDHANVDHAEAGVSDNSGNASGNATDDFETAESAELQISEIAGISVLDVEQVNELVQSQVQETASFEQWVETHLGLDLTQHDAGSSDEREVQKYAVALPERIDIEHEASSGADQQSQANQANLTNQAAPRFDASTLWILWATGSLTHAKGTLETLTLLAPDHHALVLNAAQAREHREALKQLLRHRGSTCATYEAKLQMHMLRELDFGSAYAPAYDIDLAQYLVDSQFHAKDLQELVEHTIEGFQFGAAPQPMDMQGAFNFDDIDNPQLTTSSFDPMPCARQASAIAAVAISLMPQVERTHQMSLMQGLELPVSRVLARMEYAGAAVDEQRLDAMRERFGSEVELAQQQAFEAAGKELNLQSPKQLQAVLFDDMGLVGVRKTKSGGYSTDAQTLQELATRYVNDERASNFLVALLRHREMNKLKQIVQSLIDEIDSNDRRIHTTFEQTVAATGRLSSTAPNLQNIPNRNMAGREIRSAFVPGDGYSALMSCDYSQVELRIMAHASGDESLIEAFRSGTDFHRYVASLVYGVAPEDISADQRSHVKAMSYGLAYGLSTYGLAQQLQVSPAEADILKNRYFATFGKVHEYLERLVAEAKTLGYTQTMFGRRRYFPGLRSTNRRVRDAAERAALNAPIQGTAADIMKIAMIRADQALQELGARSRVILQIHDELVVELAPGEESQVEAAVRDAMEHAVELDVPLDVSTGVGADWQLAAH